MNRADANEIFGSANIEKLRFFKISAGDVDFGDHIHIAGTPQGSAIIVWSIDGRVAVKGLLFSDNFRDPQTATIKIRFRRTTGGFTAWTNRSVASQGGPMTPFYIKLVEKVSPVGTFDQVQVRLVQTIPDTGLGPTTATLEDKTYNR